ncbi:uncharacterized protein JCM6883_003072 [Sporobolomyces salmoneus]|uniref:uncharacterized protein n=1 Tax=Sporobolomyces salmoneus TaxID=183962 RepID=UPI00316DB7D8
MGFLPSVIGGKNKRNQGSIALTDDEKGQNYERDSTRPRLDDSPRRRSISKTPDQQDRKVGHWAPHPGLIRSLRALLYLITSGASLATAGMCIAVVYYYNNVGPVIKPAWGSLIACIVFGILTPGVLFGTLLVTPRLFRNGSVPDIVNQTRMELLSLFALAAIWISGALALACDLRGKENCLWDGYYHYPKPSDFDDVCNRINYSVALAYTTFGLCALTMSVVWLITIYILLFLDQEVLTEKTNSLGTRAYLARTRAIQQRRILRAARTAEVSTSGPFNSRRATPPSSFTPRDDVPTSPRIDMAEAGPMAGGVFASRAIPKPTRPPVVEEELGGPMMIGGSNPLVQRDSNPSRTSRDRESSVRFAGDEEEGEGQNRRSVLSEERDEAMDPFEDQRGGYYGYEDERGFGAQRGGFLRV